MNSSLQPRLTQTGIIGTIRSLEVQGDRGASDLMVGTCGARDSG